MHQLGPTCPGVFTYQDRSSNPETISNVSYPGGVECWDIGPTNPKSTQLGGGVAFLRAFTAGDTYNATADQTPGLPYSSSSQTTPGAPQVDYTWIVNGSDSCGTSPPTLGSTMHDSDFYTGPLPTAGTSETESAHLCADMNFTPSTGTGTKITACNQVNLTATEIPAI